MKNTTIVNNKRTDTTVDLLKFIFCIFIIALHTKVIDLLPGRYFFINVFVRVAVPYFFVASGYYLRKKYLNSSPNQYKDVLLSYEKRLLFPYVFFLLIALRQQWTTYMLEGCSPIDFFKHLVQDALFYPKGALWFVFALMIAALLTYPFMKMKNGVNICLAIGGLLFLFALICNNYYFLIVNTPLQTFVDNYMHIFVSARNGLFFGLVFVSLGMKCYDLHSKSKDLNKKRKICIFPLVLFFVLYVAEITILYFLRCERIDDTSLYISQILFIPVLFLSSILFPISIPAKISVLLRNLSTGMYYLHRPILWWVLFLTENKVIDFIVVLLIAFVICMISYKVKFKNKYYLLK